AGPDRRAPAARPARRSAAGGRLSVVGATPGGARHDRRKGWQSDPAAQPPRGRARRALPSLWPLAPLRVLRRRPDPARGRSAALPSLRLRRARPGELPALWLGRARTGRRGHAEARDRAREAAARALAHTPRRGHDTRPGKAEGGSRAL